jgi:hypothetical protein
VKVIRCEDGAVVEGETDEELVQNTRQHIAEAHHRLVGRLSYEEILAMAKEIA